MNGHDEAADFAAMILQLRQRRTALLPRALFDEVAWEMLLHLFVADANGERMTARQFAGRTDTPLTVASRWLRFLSDEKLVAGDGDGNVDDHLTLQPIALTAIEQYMAEIGDAVREHARGARVRRSG